MLKTVNLKRQFQTIFFFKFPSLKNCRQLSFENLTKLFPSFQLSTIFFVFVFVFVFFFFSSLVCRKTSRLNSTSKAKSFNEIFALNPIKHLSFYISIFSFESDLLNLIQQTKANCNMFVYLCYEKVIKNYFLFLNFEILSLLKFLL